MEDEERLDWDQFGLTLTPEDEEELEYQQWRSAERSALAMYKDDYRWIRACEEMSIEKLQQIIDDTPWSIDGEKGRTDPPKSERDREWCLKRYRQAQIVLESRVPGYNPLADFISRQKREKKGNS